MDSDRIVLVHNGDHPEFQKLGKGVLCIFPVHLVHDRVLCHQDLRGQMIVFGKQPLIDHHQFRLSDRGTGLL